MDTATGLHQRPLYANTGYGPRFSVLEIGLTERVAVVEPDTAFWALVRRDDLAGCPCRWAHSGLSGARGGVPH